MLSSFKRLDGFTLSKVSDGNVRTLSGAIVSLISLAIMSLLFLSEVHFYFHRDVTDHLYVNTTMVHDIKVSFDISFPSIPCARLTVDVVDDMGAPQTFGSEQIYKHALDIRGERVGEAVAHSLGEAMRSEEDVKDLAELHFQHLNTLRTTMEQFGPNCGNCYGAGHAGECCNTCADVKKAYETHGWRFHRQGIAQCHFEALEETRREGESEEGGCQVYGELLLDRAAGHFHIVPHKHVHNQGLQSGLQSLLDLLAFTFDQFNITHTVNYMSFGNSYPGIRNPLDGQQRRLNDTHGMYQYYVKVVPTRYKSLYHSEVESNQYAVTEHMRHLAPGSGKGLPGVYFYYEVSPLQAVFEEERKGLLQFLTGACAVVGGVYTVMGLVDTLVGSLSKVFHRNIL